MATLTDPTAGEGEDRRRERAPDTGRNGEQIALLLAELSGLKKAVVERQNEMEKMISRRTRERQHSFLRQGNQSQYDFTNIGASLRAGPCFGCGEWGHLKRNCPRSVRGAMPPTIPSAPVHIPPTSHVIV